jgi:hypothetical protein
LAAPAPTVNLATNFADMQWTVVTGTGRRAPGEMIAKMQALDVRNSSEDLVITTKVINATLNSYALYSISDQFALPNGLAFKQYTLFPLKIQEISGEDTNGNPVSWAGFFSETFDADVMLARGRDTVLQFNLNDAIIPTADPFTGPVFDRNLFELENYNPNTSKIEALFSDYVAFDISGMAPADRPNIVINATPAGECDMVLFTGDSVAISSGIDALDTFQILSPNFDPMDNIDTGQINSPTIIGGAPADGTYTLFEPDWSLVDPTQGIIVSLQGRWRPYTQVLGGIGSNMMVVFPNSRNDTENFSVVYIARDGAGAITALWHGVARFSGPNANEIRLTRVRDALSLVEIDPAVGVLSDFIMLNGEVTVGTFTFSALGLPVDFTLPLTGQFRVFRK